MSTQANFSACNRLFNAIDTSFSSQWNGVAEKRNPHTGGGGDGHPNVRHPVTLEEYSSIGALVFFAVQRIFSVKKIFSSLQGRPAGKKAKEPATKKTKVKQRAVGSTFEVFAKTQKNSANFAQV